MSGLRIGLLTYHFSDNYGALLQAYGLRRWFMSEGHAADFVPYHPAHIEEGGAFIPRLDRAALRANIKICYLRFSHRLQRLMRDEAQSAAFDAFRREALGVTGDRGVRSPSEVAVALSKRDAALDVIICGSDQIWSPSAQYGFDATYFGEIPGYTKARVVAYAPSFGRATLALDQEDELRSLLGRVNGLSVRERSGVELVARLTGREVAYVPDPTILWGDFNELIALNPAHSSGHVFVYALRSATGLREIAEFAGRELRADIVSPYNPHRRWPEVGRTVKPSPGEWVSMIDAAGFVVTNSFHGTVFSILRQRPFFVVGLPKAKSTLNERSLNLLREVGLEHRFIPNGDVAAARLEFGKPIEWGAVRARVAKLQASGREYLQRELMKARIIA